MEDRAEAALAASHLSARNALRAGSGAVRLVAHRGSGHAFNDPTGPPENTLAAVAYGYAQGADAVEVDAWRTADGQVVLFHDETSDRTTNRPGWTITQTAFADLLTASAGAWKGRAWADAGIPTLTLCAELVPPGRGLVVEIEEGPQVVSDILGAIAPAGLGAQQVMFISKNLDTAAEAKRQAPDHRTLWVVDTTPRWQVGGWTQGHRRGADSHRAGYDEPTDCHWLADRAHTYGLDGLDTLFAYPPDLPAAVADAGLLWMVWTANDPRAVDLCVRDGVWGVTTDNTAAVRQWLLAAGITTGAGW